MKKLSGVFVLLALCLQLRAQYILPDSIADKFIGDVHDSVFVDRINLIATHNLRGHPDVSRYISMYAQEEAQRINYIGGYARALAITGNSYWYEGSYENAQSYYLAAARQYMSINDSVGYGGMYNNIGEVYKRLEQYDKALEYQLLSYELRKSSEDGKRIVIYNIGETYIYLNQYDQANEYLQRAFELSKAANDKRVLAYCYAGFGLIELKSKRFEKAIDYFSDSEKLWLELGEKRSVIQIDQNFALAYRGLKDYKKADAYLDKSQRIIKEIHAIDLLIKNYLYKSRLDSAKGKYEMAFAYLSKYNTLKDSLFARDKVEQVNRYQTIYETQNREKENVQLRSEKMLREAEISSQRVFIAVIGVGLIFASSMFFLVYNQRKKILSVNRELKDKSEEIKKQSESLQRLNEELQNLNRNLENIVEQRTSQLLEQNKKLAEYTFINAHKLRSPVASILGLIGLLPQATEAEREVIFGHLKTSGENLDKIIREVGRNLEGAIVEHEE